MNVFCRRGVVRSGANVYFVRCGVAAGVGGGFVMCCFYGGAVAICTCHDSGEVRYRVVIRIMIVSQLIDEFASLFDVANHILSCEAEL